jgi:hypothetical protein
MGISYILFFEPNWVIWLECQLRHLLHLPSVPLVATGVSRPPPKKYSLLLRTGYAVLTALLTVFLTATIWGGFGRDDDVWSKLASTKPMVVQTINHQLHLASPWSMFAYRTIPRTGWLEIDGHIQNGDSLPLYTSRDPATGQIRWLWGPGTRLRFFEQRLLWSIPDTILHAWGSYYCRLYNQGQEHSPTMQLATVEIHRLYRWAHEPGALPNPYEEDLLWRHQCSID